MSLLHKTNSVLNFFQPNDLFELTDRYQILNTDEYQSINQVSRKEISNLYNINFMNDVYSSENKKSYKTHKGLSENKNKKINPFENNILNLSNKKSIKIIESNDKDKSQIKKHKIKKLGYMNEKYIKMLEENKALKEKLNTNEKNNKELIKKLKEENSKLKNDIENLNKLNEDHLKNINEKNEIIDKQKIELDNLNKKITDLTEEKNNLDNEIKNMKIIVEKLSEDKNILINEISELNSSLSNTIKPKLIKNENYLLSLEKQFNLLKKENESLIEKEIKQKLLIKTFKTKNKIKKQNSRKNTNLSNIIQSNSLSIEELSMNTSMYGSTSKKNNIFRKKPRKNSNTKGIIKPSKIIKNLKNNKLRKCLSQNNIGYESNIKNKNDADYDINSSNKKKSTKKKESVKQYDIYNIYNKKKIKYIPSNSSLKKINHNNTSLLGNKATLLQFSSKFINKMLNEENKQDEIIIINKKKDTNVSFLSSYNGDKI